MVRCLLQFESNKLLLTVRFGKVPKVQVDTSNLGGVGGVLGISNFGIPIGSHQEHPTLPNHVPSCPCSCLAGKTRLSLMKTWAIWGMVRICQKLLQIWPLGYTYTLFSIVYVFIYIYIYIHVCICMYNAHNPAHKSCSCA